MSRRTFRMATNSASAMPDGLRKRALLAFLLSLFLSTSLLADSQGLSSQSAAAVDSTVKEFMKTHSLKGVGIGVLSRGRLAYVQAYGTMFRFAPVDLASLSKPLTAALAFKLAEEGKFDIDAPVTRYLPDVKLPATVTARTLLSHTSGLPAYNGRFPSSGFQRNAFGPSALVNAPGESYIYSSPGYVLLSWSLEEAGGSSLIDMVNEKLCRPARASDLELSEEPRYSWRLGAGGLEGSPEAMSRLALAFLQRRILTRESYRSMWSPKTQVPGKGYQQGLGFRLESKGRVTHGGSQPRDHYYHRMVLYPDREHGMVILLQGNSGEAKKLPGKLSTALYKTLKGSGHKF